MNNTAELLTGEQFIEKLRNALTKDGDFPANAQVVAELKKLTSQSNTTANQVAELILREPTLGTRILHLVNSAYYRRAKPIMTVSQAVLQIGMQQIAELCSGLVLLQKFIPLARKGGGFAQCLQLTVVTSLLSSILYSKASDQQDSTSGESGYLAGSFYQIGTLLMAFYFPNILETALKRSETKGILLGSSISEITGYSPGQISIEIIDELNLPVAYKTLIQLADGFELRQEEVHTASLNLKVDVTLLSACLSCARRIAEAFLTNSQDKLEQVLAELISRYNISNEILNNSLIELAKQYQEHLDALDLQLAPLPEFINKLSKGVEDGKALGEEKQREQTPSDIFTAFLNEVKECVDNGEPISSIITSVMETLVWGLGFDRALLLLNSPDKTSLLGRMYLSSGKSSITIDPKEIVRNLRNNSDYAAEVKAYNETQVVVTGDPLFEDGWPFAVLPVGYNKRIIGVIYADKIENDLSSNDELTEREKAAISVLSEMLDKCLAKNY